MKHSSKKSFMFIFATLMLMISLIRVTTASALLKTTVNGSVYSSGKPPAAPIVKEPPSFTNDTTPVISGIAEEDTRVNVWYINDHGDLVQICRNVLVDDFDDHGDSSMHHDDHEELEAWSCISSKVLPEGNIELVVKATDKSGRTSPATSHFFTIDLTAPSMPVVTSPSGFTNDTTPTISGTAEAGSHVNVWYLDNSGTPVQICENVLADSLGNWSCTSSKILPEREIELVVNVTDAAGNTSADALYSFTVDTTFVDVTPPTVASITRASPNPASAASVDYTITFSEPVMGVDTNDFILDTATISGAAVSSVAGSGSTWTVTVNTGTGDGTLRLNIPITATITDLAGNPLGGLPFTGAETYTVEKTPPACTVQIYDDTHSNWVYTGTWASTSIWSEAYNSTLHYTSTMGDYAELAFTGMKFTLIFTKDSNRGLLDVYVDGNKLTTLDVYSPSLIFQQTYTSPTLTNGSHTVRLVHAGGRPYMDIDALQVYRAPVAVSAGTYDDTNCNWVYTGAWSSTSIWTQAYNSTLHYTSTAGDYAELTFSGTQFTLIFTKDINRGMLDVYVDGNKLTTLDVYWPSLIFQQTYTSPTLTSGNHTLRLVHAGGRPYMDVDAITILP